MPRRIASLNMTLARTFHVTERYSLQLRWETFNATNSPMYGGPVTSDTDPRFGILPVAQQNLPRLIQVSGKFLF